jgi:hypothetical protein
MVNITDDVQQCPLCDEEKELKQLYYHLQIYHNKSEIADQLLDEEAHDGGLE